MSNIVTKTSMTNLKSTQNKHNCRSINVISIQLCRYKLCLGEYFNQVSPFGIADYVLIDSYLRRHTDTSYLQRSKTAIGFGHGIRTDWPTITYFISSSHTSQANYHIPGTCVLVDDIDWSWPNS